MAQMGPISQSEMPDFNILGLLLGGRGYAANWFSKRDELQLMNQQRSEREQFASGLLGADYGQDANAAYGRAMDNPYDRRAQMGLWGRMYGGPESAAALGNGLIDKSMSAIYGREQTAYEDTLQRARIRLTADEELRVDETKRKRDLEARKALVAGIFGPDGQTAANQFNRNQAYNQATGGQLPQGMDVVPGPQGGLAFRPAPGSPQFREMMDEIQPQQSILASLRSLQEMAENGTGSSGAWNTERQLVQLEIQKARKLGALDSGTIDFLDSMIPGAWSDWTATPAKWGETKERLRVLTSRMEGNLAATGNKWLVPVNEVANAQEGRGWMGDIDKPVPKGPARAASDRASARAKEIRDGRARTDEAGSIIGGMAPQKNSGGGW